MTQRDEFHQQAEARDKESSYFDRAVKNLKIVFGAIAFAYVAIFSGGVWVATVQGNIATIKEAQAAQAIKIIEAKTAADSAATALALKNTADGLVFQAHQVLLDANKTRIEALEPLVKEHAEMYFNLQNGINNQDAFFRKHGYYAPVDPRSEQRKR